MSGFIPVFRREWSRLLARKKLFALILVGPLLYALILAGSYSREVVIKMPIAVLDEDQSMISRTLVRYLNATRSLDVRYFAQDPEEIKTLIRRDRIAAAVILPRNLQKEIKRGGSGEITAWINGTNLLLANIASSEIRTVVGTVSAGIKIKLLRKSGNSFDKAFALQSPVQVDVSRLYNPSFNYLNYLAPGLWIAAFYQILMLIGALLLAWEQELGTIPDLWKTARFNPMAVIFGKLVPIYLIALVELELSFRLFFPWLGIQMRGSIPILMLYSGAFILASLAMGFLISSWFRTRIDALKGVLLLAAPAFLLSGYTWPTRQMPAPVQWLSSLMPLTSALQGFRRLYQLGESIAAVRMELIILLALAVAFLSLSAFGIRRRMVSDARIP